MTAGYGHFLHQSKWGWDGIRGRSLERCGDVVNSDGTMPFAIASYDQSNNWLKPAGMLQAISPEHPVGMNA
ncbi:hypothetical protein B7R77_20040 [Ralstonia solanacearum K60]|uniref:Uncharacterized protein n=1 Tax=Ralstonia solanacearum K60 TaxID=1091042 RepID=A0AAP7ZHU8_RALSL|nr:hypothetical protein B7R77_20040 [Ralstonia solanacearum K60]RIJ84851.1 hypothetical protein RSP822_19215 [Ralstonia solanacearum]